MSTGTETSVIILEGETILPLSIISLETFIGSLVNGFMVVVNIVNLLRYGTLSSCDLILTCLGISRFLYQWLFFSVCFFIWTNGLAYSGSHLIIVFVIVIFLNNTSLWFATWLCTLYCVRIVNINWSIFIILKRHFDRWIPFLLGASTVISIVPSIILACFSQKPDMNFPLQQSANNTTELTFSKTQQIIFSATCTSGTIPPFIIFCIGIRLMVGSLWNHTQRMKSQCKTSFRKPSMKAHYGAIQFMGWFYLFYLFSMVGFNTFVLGGATDPFVALFCISVVGAYPSIHSVFIVFGNSKLRTTFIKLLRKARCYFLKSPQTEMVAI
ncbi:taste receptor type 2 member 40-like [Pelobates fuscus]|uniref:taste receptor type 2 member 40-like n=1 Tax=Pelobates fuscus TaxID=191477 RepID=UPI002FE4B36F